MAKITAYPDGAPPLSTDNFIIARAGNNFKMLWSSIITALRTSILSASIIYPAAADINAVSNTRYFADISGLTANRNFILPVPAIGDIIELFIPLGDNQYSLIIKGAATVTINHGAAATEWSRVMTTGEKVILVADTLTNWQVSLDGRIPCVCRIYSSVLQNLPFGAATKVTFDTTLVDNAYLADLVNDYITIRRSNNYRVSGSVQLADGYVTLRWLTSINIVAGGEVARAEIDTASAGAFPCVPISTAAFPLVAGNSLTLSAYHTNAAVAPRDTVAAVTHMEVVELLPT